MRKIILLVLLLAVLPVTVFGIVGNTGDGKPKNETKVEFVQDVDKGLSKLKSLFDQAKYNVYISMYTLTNKEIINKIVEVSKSGIKIFLILDKHENQKTNDYKLLLNHKNVYLKLVSKNYYDYKYHKKIAIFDAKTIFTGSSNWTKLAFTTNDEQNFIIFSNEEGELAKTQFLKEWKELK